MDAGAIIVGLPPSYTAKPKAAQAPEKTFPLEGRKGDLFEAVSHLGRTSPDGPTYPGIGSIIFPSLDAMDDTVKALGKKPTPEEVDRSNLRRLTRALEPVLSAYQDCYPEKGFDKASKELKSVGKALGSYKDLAVVESELKAVNDGVVPKDVQKALDKSRKKSEEQFKDAYKHFRKKGLPKAQEVLSKPTLSGVPDPQKLVKDDRARLSAQVTDCLGKTEKVGLQNQDPHDFHEGRKALRSTLNAINASSQTVSVDKPSVERATQLVDLYGQAQDANICADWLKDKGFKGLAKKARARFETLQGHALEQAKGFDLSSLRPQSH